MEGLIEGNSPRAGASAETQPSGTYQTEYKSPGSSHTSYHLCFPYYDSQVFSFQKNFLKIGTFPVSFLCI